jgi:hypothetical protein
MKRNISPNLREQLLCFFEQHPAQEFSNSLRSLLLEYMRANVRTGFHPEFDNFLWAMDDLFQLLDTAAEEECRVSKPGT